MAPSKFTYVLQVDAFEPREGGGLRQVLKHRQMFDTKAKAIRAAEEWRAKGFVVVVDQRRNMDGRTVAIVYPKVTAGLEYVDEDQLKKLRSE